MSSAAHTVLITGASSGIGAAYAAEFASRGDNLILVARRVDRLEQLAERLRAAHRVEVDVLSADLSADGAAGALWGRLGGRPIEVLVNNAGFGHGGHFVDEAPELTRDEIHLNVLTLVELARLALPGMMERRTGAIVNIASTASFQPVPGMAVYGATKAFVRSFTEALWAETRGSGVRVLAVNPGATATEFFEVASAKPKGIPVPVAHVVSRTMRALDRADSPSVVVGFSNAVTAKLVQILPKRFVINTVARMFLPERTR
ncbi:MAG TPA: SDR family oxidoreductase [Microbacteriaceae bacterium]|nr:SDR family oxidoreductase [Microbacteriaceae bacterium]